MRITRDLNTVPELRAAIKLARKGIWTQVRFGCSERWVKISKAEALELADTVDGLTPQQAEMFTGRFGELNGGAVYLG